MDDQISQLILDELQGLRRDVNDGFREITERVAIVETHVNPFFATDGGREKMQAQIEGIVRRQWYAMGGIAVIMAGARTLLKKLGM